MDKVWNEVDFLCADKCQSFLQVDTTIFGRRGQACLNRQSNYKILRSVISHKVLDGLL